ncbi:hypothetical protein BOO71_0007042 [Deinococcus marmoris]|uniref:Uncharacterized protein n=1 Tax=Deinococcus marmoris TaxID=249408 RepID=A0A1U7NYJ5_9DEIO|nr:hypothetical protein BOO71_0007042 [Deinococcus marmoris]
MYSQSCPALIGNGAVGEVVAGAQATSPTLRMKKIRFTVPA